MAGLDPAIHVFCIKRKEDVDARVKPGHDERYFLNPSSGTNLPTTYTDPSAVR